MSINEVLDDRGKTYGEFRDCAIISQELKKIMRLQDGWKRLTCAQSEALEMVQHKIARILNGDPNHKDSWIDIEGYAKLVSDQL